MTVHDFFGFSLERTSSTFSKRVNAALLNVPSVFQAIAGGAQDTLPADSISGQEFEFRNKDILTGTIVVGMRIRFNQPDSQPFLTLVNGVTDEQISVAAAKYDDGTTSGQTYFILKQGLTVVATSTVRYTGLTYHWVEFTAVPSTNELGSYELRVDGFPIIQASGLNVGDNDLGIDGVFVQITSGPGIPLVDASITELDQMWIADGFLGPKSVDSLYPEEDGSLAGWDVIGAASNSEAVDESESGTSDGDTSYVKDDGTTDTYRMNTSFLDGRLDAVSVESYLRDQGGDFEPTDLIKLRDGELNLLATIPVANSSYERKNVIEQLPDYDRRSLIEMEFGQGDAGAVVAPPHNTIVFTVDEVTLDSLALYDAINPFSGDDPANGVSQIYVQTPNLDSVASSGVQLLSAYANSSGSGTLASILTGLYAFKHSIGSSVVVDNRNLAQNFDEFGDSGRHLTFVDLLKNNGIQTALVGQYKLGLDTSENGAGWDGILAQTGYTTYAASFRNLDSPPYPSNPPGPTGDYYHWRRRHSTQGTTNFTYSNLLAPPIANFATTVQVTDAITFANTLSEPFVLIVNLNGIGSPRTQAPDSLVSTPEYKIGLPGDTWENSQGNLEAIDEELGRFLSRFESGRSDRTTFMFLGSSGSSKVVLEDLQANRSLGATYNSLLSFAGEEARFNNSVYDRGGHIPCILWGNQVKDGGRTSDAQFHVSDVFSTILSLQGVALPTLGLDDVVIDSVSALPIIKNTVDAYTHLRKEGLIEHFAPNGLVPTFFENNWSNVLAYFVDDRIWFNATTEYICIQNNTGQSPGSSPTYWSVLNNKFKRQSFHYVLEDGAHTTGVYSLISISGLDYEMYRLKDGAGLDVDPYELSPLEITGAYLGEFELIKARFLELVGEQDTGPTGELPPMSEEEDRLVPTKIQVTDELGDTSGRVLANVFDKYVIKNAQGADAILIPHDRTTMTLPIIDELDLAGTVDLTFS